MKTKNILITSNEKIKESCISLFSLNKKDLNLGLPKLSELNKKYINLEIYTNKDDLELIFYKSINNELAIKYIQENILIIGSLLLLWYTNKICSDYRDSDVILPTAILSNKWEPIFIESYEKSKDYDFDKFGLSIWAILWENENIEGADIFSKDLADISWFISKTDLINNLRIISWIINNDKSNIKEVSNNIVFIARFIIESMGNNE